MVARQKKFQIQARRRSFVSVETGLPLYLGRGAPDEFDWFSVSWLPLLTSEADAGRFLQQNENNMIFEYRVVPASKKLPA